MIDHLDAAPDDLALLVRVIRAAVAWRYCSIGQDGYREEIVRVVTDLECAVDALPIDLAIRFGRPVVVLDE